jgi:hypothetical protein
MVAMRLRMQRQYEAASSLSQFLLAAVNPNSALLYIYIIQWDTGLGYGLDVGLCMVYSYGDGPLMV